MEEAIGELLTDRAQDEHIRVAAGETRIVAGRSACKHGDSPGCETETQEFRGPEPLRKMLVGEKTVSRESISVSSSVSLISD